MAGTITHQWTGTVLTITSDSGTSSSDLKGERGDDGPRGAQGAPGSSVAEDSQKLGGVAAAQYALKNGVPAHNLLDNSDFRNPVNQRGQTSYTGSAFTIDRWRTWNDSATITLTSDGIKGGGTDATVLYQGIELHKIKLGTAYTVAIGYSDSTISCATGTLTASSGVGIWNDEIQAFLLWNDGSPFMRLWHATKTIQWAAIYPGSYDASTLPAYQPKGYAAELAECQRYFTRVGNSSAYGIISGTGCVVKVPIPTTMRNNIVPTVTLDSPLWAYSHEGYVHLNYTGTTYSTNTASLHFTVDTSMSARSCVVPDLSCNISADL